MSDDDEDQQKYEVKYRGQENSQPAIKEDGFATAIFPNGDSYVGTYSLGTRHGEGEYTWKEKNAKYVGTYFRGKKHNLGRMTYPNGDKYTGEWKNDRRQGYGTLYYANGDRYSGNWEAGKKHGQGTYIFSEDGSQITGTFKAGELMSGTWKYADGSKFVGSFSGGVPSGQGLYVFASGTQQSGNFSQGKWKSHQSSRSSEDIADLEGKLLAVSTTATDGAEGSPASMGITDPNHPDFEEF